MGEFRELLDTARNARAAERRTSSPQTSGGKVSGASKYFTAPKLEGIPAWEYAMVQYLERVSTVDTINREINQLGSYGWELCERRDSGTGITRADTFFTLIFKRRTA